ncbi:GIN domain-containing protein, partial [Chloroflexota bacterium]
MKKTVAAVLVVVLLMSGLMVGCGGVVTGSGKPITDTFDYGDFTAVEAHNGFQVEIKKSSDFNVEITVDDNLQEYLEVDKSGNTLRISMQQNRLYTSATLSAKITMPDISRLDLSGGSRADVIGFNLSHDLSIELSGGSH